jgi:hypothetical protein
LCPMPKDLRHRRPILRCEKGFPVGRRTGRTGRLLG